MQQPDKKSEGMAPPPYPGAGAGGYAAGGFVAPPPQPAGYAPPQQPYGQTPYGQPQAPPMGPVNPGYAAPGGVSLCTPLL